MAVVSSTTYGILRSVTKIVCDPNVLQGKPIVEGTRISVELVLEKLVAGETLEDLLEAHPRLTRAGIQAALSFAVDVVKNEVVYPLAG
ncbi:DUF433 domain-containing protein [bacterium]|nr:DUF433 domain-containing protein [bacterium]